MNRLSDKKDKIVWVTALSVLGALLTETDDSGLVVYEHGGRKFEHWLDKDEYILYETITFQHYEDTDGTFEL